jgi:hypothetical protein
VIREFSIVGADGSVQNPYAEVDVKTSGGHDSYNAMQLSLTRPSMHGLTLNAQYTLSKSFGNSAGSNEAQTVGNNARAIGDFDYDDGYNRFDVRHTYNVSAVYALPIGAGKKKDLGSLGNAILGNWQVGAILNGRSGLPIDVLVTRPDVAYRDASGRPLQHARGGRTAIINTPGGGNSRNVRRPNLIPGVDPYLKNGNQWLNPAAFAIPAAGEFGNLQRGADSRAELPAVRPRARQGHPDRRTFAARPALRGVQRLQHDQLRAAVRAPQQRAGHGREPDPA